jgi:hypothetical protein
MFVSAYCQRKRGDSGSVTSIASYAFEPRKPTTSTVW